MVSGATFEILREYAEMGQFGGAVELRADRLDPEVGTAIRVEWDFRETDLPSGVLEIPGEGRIRVPNIGHRRVEIGVAPFEIRLIAGDEIASIAIEPRVIVPRITEFSVHGQAMVGEAFVFAWRVEDAQTCALVVEDGEQVSEQHVATHGQIRFVPRHLGMLQAVLTARGIHAPLSDEAIVSERLELHVAPPPVRIEMPALQQTALVGDEVRFDWTIQGATRAVLDLVDRDETRDVQLDGHMWVEVGAEDERFRLTAIGLDGTEHQKAFRVVPRLFNLSDIPTDVSLLKLPWR